jgi:hypothetical protein
MGRRKNKGSNAPAAVVEDDSNGNFQDAVQDAIVEMESNDDAAVSAALDAADQTDEAPAEGADETVETVATEDVAVELEPEDEDAVLAELEAEEDDQAPAPAAKSGRKARTPKAASTPAVVRQFCDVADHLDDAELKSRLDGINAKKVAEKAQNLVQCIETGKKLSGFTALAVKTLAANGSVTSKDLVEAFQADGKSLGTARAQAQQMTALFKALGIAQPDPSEPRKLVAADNGLVRELSTLAA